MRRLTPDPTDLELDELYADLLLDTGDRHGAESPRPWVALGMVASVDGAAAVGGATAGLGGEADRVAFGRLRAACDVILVGAGTVRDEDYGPPVGSVTRQQARETRGLAPVPRLAIVSGSLRLDPSQRVFGDPAHRPLVLTHDAAPSDRAARLADVADVVRRGAQEVDLPAMLAHLGDLGLRRVLCEGGPRLNDSLLAADLVDEVFLTVASVAVGGDAPRIVAGAGAGEARPLRLVSVHEHDHELLLRYRVVR